MLRLPAFDVVTPDSVDGVVAALMLKQYLRNPETWETASAQGLGGTGW